MTLPATAPRDEVALAVSREFMQTARRLPTLFTLEDDAVRLLTLCENVNDPELVAEFEAELALIDQLMIEKTESYCSVIRSLESMASARKAEADRLRDRARSAERQAEWLKQRLLVHMQTTARPRIETARFTLAIRQNPPSCTVVDAAAVPSEYQRTKIEISVDRRSILEDFKRSGVIPAGVEITHGQRLSIA